MNWGIITFFILYVILGSITLARLIHFIKVEGKTITVPKVLLTFNILGCIFSAIIVIDLQGYRGWYVTMQYMTTYYFWLGTPVLYQFIIFSGYVANILVKFSQHKKILNLLNISVTGLLMTLFVVSNIVFSVYGYTWNFNAAIGNAITIIIAVIEGVTGLFFLFSSFILVARLAAFSNMHSGNREQTKKRYLFLSLMLLFAFFFNALGFAITIAITSKKINIHGHLHDIQY
eukprot:TRINITY_DN12668_c0_g1_i1.p1 TRINITY_DN12668_c0_g1~~TRINITY_DN12668_c0_g1_i1.p1  ORF type:complete len:231 (-),score=31.93 TRINITY_DN12668_c0_g1_i1:126-818(-)